MNKNDIIVLDIIDMNNLGAGVGKIDGAVVFVGGAVTGDKVECKIIKVTKSYYVAKLLRVIEASRDRAEGSLCSAPQSCGGCVYRSLTREGELQMKRTYLEGLFKKAGLADISILPVMTVSPRVGYRNKAQYPVRATKDGIKAGFFASKTHSIVSSAHCALEPDIFGEIVTAVCDFADRLGISAYDEETGRGILRHIYIRRGEVSGEIMLCLVINADKMPASERFGEFIKEKFPSVVSCMLNVNKKNTNVILGKDYINIFGKGYIEDTLCGLNFRISPESFWQVNRAGAEVLYGLARELAGLKGDENLLDLYCGTGTIGLSMAKYVRSLTGVEIVEGAVQNARVNAEINGITNAEFYCADATQTESIIPDGKKYDVVILDPPRKGTTEELISYIAKRNIERVVYISCGPDTLARDIVTFRKYGYDCGDIQPVDMFPTTGHVECVTLLSRKGDVHQMKLHTEPFKMIKSGEKTIELRLYDEKRQKIKIGDEIVFINNISGEALKKRVCGLHIFASFDELYSALPLLRCGYTEQNLSEAKAADMEKYYSIEEQTKYGVVGIELI